MIRNNQKVVIIFTCIGVTLLTGVGFLLDHGGIITKTPLGIIFYALFIYQRLTNNQTREPEIIKSALDSLGSAIILVLFVVGSNWLNNRAILSTATTDLFLYIFSSIYELYCLRYSTNLLGDYIQTEPRKRKN